MDQSRINQIKESFKYHLLYSLAKDETVSTEQDIYQSLAFSVRDRLIERWIKTQKTYFEQDAKKVYYLSMEFLMGRTLGNSLINLGLYEDAAVSMKDLGYELEELRETEWDAGLGNGGLGRLAACFLDSMATLELPGYGYGIRYEYGIFFQQILNGYQVETPDNWLRFGNPWEIPRPECIYPVRFYGRTHQYKDKQGILRTEWLDAEQVLAMAYDTPIPAYGKDTVNNLRLWSAKSTREFNFNYFNDGDYEKAVAEKAFSENISKVLYPNDNIIEGKELRLKQEYFFVSATLQDIIWNFKRKHDTFDNFHEKNAVQLNDTHPAIAIPELMRILMDTENLTWEEAWRITEKTFGYTNHTILPEALEKWPLPLMQRVLPRHVEIIFEINRRFLEDLKNKYPGKTEKIRRMSIIEEGAEKHVRMANLAIVGSHSVNGVAELHSRILKERVFHDFQGIWPDKFNNKTNGITQRRWLRLCNPGLSELITSKIGDGWITNLNELDKLTPFADDEEFQNRWMKIKLDNKIFFKEYILDRTGIEVNENSMFDIHIKRLHEYKRQLLNVLHVITLYNRIRKNPGESHIPRTIIFAGKAAPGYHMAKLIIKLITSVGDVVNNHPVASDLMKVVFLRNYAVSNAEKIIPAADLSQQISTAGMEASGTGNMKLALNGALTIGTLDGANIEIREEVGEENFFLFGHRADEAAALREKGYNPRDIYYANEELRECIDMIMEGHFSEDNPSQFQPIVDSLLNKDQYLLFADYESYIFAQQEADKAFADKKRWARMSILNVARMGKFSTDRTISQYADEIWNLKPVKIEM